MSQTPPHYGQKGVAQFLAIAAIAAVLYAARSICIPFALAVLLSFLLTPVVSRLEKWKLPRVPAVLVAMLLILLLVAFGGYLVLGQLVQLADRLPQYQTSVHEKLNQLHPKPGSTFDRLNHTFDYYASEVKSITAAPSGSQSATVTGDPGGATSVASGPAPIEVTLTKPRATGLDVLQTLVARTIDPLSVLGLVFILTLFMLIQREDIRDRLLRLIGRGQMHVTTRTLDETGERVGRYLLFQLIVNVVFGFCTFVGLYFIGVPNSPLWGLLATSLRFIPYFGIPIAALPPTVLAFLTAPGFSGVVLTVGLFVSLEIVVCYFVEPWLYGEKTGISPVAILASAIFWGWIWGPVGLLLSTPLTVCLETVGRHVPTLRFLHVIFGDKPALTPGVRFYQRLLADDEDEATAIAAEFLEDSNRLKLYDSVLLPALLWVEQDHRHGDLQDEGRLSFYSFMRTFLSELEDHASNPPPAAGPLVLCIAASNEADDMGGRMLAGYLGSMGVPAQVLGTERLVGESIKRIQEVKPDIICISATPPQAKVHARYLCKRIRAANIRAKVLVGIWGASDEKLKVQDGSNDSLGDIVVTNFADAASHIVSQRTVETAPLAVLTPS